MKANDFLELGHEEKSIFIRSLFEQAARNYGQEDTSLNEGNFEYIGESNNKLYLTTTLDNANNLTSYNELLFPEASRLVIDDSEVIVEISPSILRRYCSANTLKNLKDLLSKLESVYEKWKSDPSILDRDEGMMDVVVRGLTCDSKGTPSFYYCDSQRIIAEQFSHYKLHFPRVQSASPIAGEIFKNMIFPAIEGREVNYYIYGVPFSSFNGRTYNDVLCLFLKFTTSQDYDKFSWPISEKDLANNGAYIDILEKHSGVSLLPSIAERQSSEDYINVIRMPLPYYLLACLHYQRHLKPEDRLPKEDKTRATDKELDHAIATLSKLTLEYKNLCSQDPIFVNSHLRATALKINQALDTLQEKIRGLHQYHFNGATQQALYLLECLKVAKDQHLSNLENQIMPALHANNVFKKRCTRLIIDTKAVLERDLGWGEYLTNLLKEIANLPIRVASFGQAQTFFTPAPSKSFEVIEEAKQQLAL